MAPVLTSDTHRHGRVLVGEVIGQGIHVSNKQRDNLPYEGVGHNMGLYRTVKAGEVVHTPRDTRPLGRVDRNGRTPAGLTLGIAV